MTPTTQITVRLPVDLVEWLDEHVDNDYPSRAALVTQAIRRARRRQEAAQDLAMLLAAEPDPDEEARLAWMETRDYPEMGEPARVLGNTLLDRAAGANSPEKAVAAKRPARPGAAAAAKPAAPRAVAKPAPGAGQGS